MQKYFEKIKERLEALTHDNPMVTDNYIMRKEAIEIVNQVAEEYSNSEIPNKSEKLTSSDDVCEWRLCDEEANVYDTSCRNPHILLEGSPSDNNYSFCPYCGRKIKENSNGKV